MAIYKLPLDDELDKDIIDWIASFPRNRKSEMVRQVLKKHINGDVQSMPIPKPPVAEKPVDKKSKDLDSDVEKDDFDVFDKLEDTMGITEINPRNLDGIIG